MSSFIFNSTQSNNDSIPFSNFNERNFSIDVTKGKNLKYSDISPLDYLKLCQATKYKPSNDHVNNIYPEQILPSGWERIDISDTDESWDGFFGAAYRRGNHVVVAIRGTNDFDNPQHDTFSAISRFIPDLFNDFMLAIGKLPPQFLSAKSYFDKIASNLKEHETISLTGHSLGGAISQLIAVKENVRAMVFDSPGVQELLPSVSIEYDRERFEQLITIINSSPNIINMCNKHIVNPIRIVAKEIDITIGNIFDSVLFTLDNHPIESLLQNFCNKTGMPKRYVNVKEWPVFVSVSDITDIIKESVQEPINIVTAKLTEFGEFLDGFVDLTNYSFFGVFESSDDIIYSSEI